MRHILLALVLKQERACDEAIQTAIYRTAIYGGEDVAYGTANHTGDNVNETVDDLTVEYEENGQLLVKELDKVVLSKGAWTTIIFRYQQWRPETDDYGSDKYVIQRYKKSGGEYKRQSKFNISSAEQARKIVDALTGWLENDEPKSAKRRSGKADKGE